MKTRPEVIPVSGPFFLVRVIYHLPKFIKVFVRLCLDSRVPLYAKAVPLLMLLWIMPFDLDWLPVLGWIDDLVVLILGARLFIRLCPADVVSEHVRAVAEGR